MGITNEQYVQFMEQLFEQPGWELLIEDARGQIYQYQCDAIEAKTWEDVQRMRGRAEQLAEIISLTDMVATQRAEMEIGDIEENREDAAL